MVSIKPVLNVERYIWQQENILALIKIVKMGYIVFVKSAEIWAKSRKNAQKNANIIMEGYNTARVQVHSKETKMDYIMFARNVGIIT
ncbi:hypothetical protein [Thermosediminibacter oceani]|uniref:hypothetical protein n=1 Tax=Thermosediminibacter oceani TaxID=291990 RepID=UPI0002F46910|nr:hypothetical protein [Thermosediminibacter oceani]